MPTDRQKRVADVIRAVQIESTTRPNLNGTGPVVSRVEELSRELKPTIKTDKNNFDQLSEDEIDQLYRRR